LGGKPYFWWWIFDRIGKTVLNKIVKIEKTTENQELDNYFHIKLIISKYLGESGQIYGEK